jgi:Holliday junction resolvasome RuvABC ATP-dependent DNA helicase subunit
MYFIGQRHIMQQLKDILPYLYENKDKGMNILIRGPSGWGKTRMSFMVCNYLANGDFDYCLGDRPFFNEGVRVHFIDEVHLLEHAETLYPMMDSGKYVIVLATNDVALLPEALSNRCVQFSFIHYSIEELRDITKPCLMCNISDELLDYLIESGADNPRIIKSLASRINIILSRNPSILVNMPLDKFKGFMGDVFGIQDGMDVMCNQYLDALKSVGGTASIETLSAYAHIDKSTLKFYVEPILLYKNRIKISSKGRSLI